MQIFIDTEFTQLDWTAKLISIALVDENEDTFYVELSDNYDLSDCSDFVVVNVLPHLIGTKSEMSYDMAALYIGKWVESRGVPCIFATDAPHWDMRLIAPMLENFWPENLARDTKLVSIPYNKEQALFLKYGFIPHFALHDAIVNKRGTVGE